METVKKVNGENAEIIIKGRVDTSTAPVLDAEINSLTDIKELKLNFTEVEYISSAGLRVLLSAQKKYSKIGRMYLTGVIEDVMEVFDMTGFSDILEIE